MENSPVHNNLGTIYMNLCNPTFMNRHKYDMPTFYILLQTVSRVNCSVKTGF